MIAKSLIKKLKDQIEKQDSGRANIIRETGSLVREATHAAAVEEFLEASYLLRVMQKKALSVAAGFKTRAEEELSALSDLTGELVRAATLDVTRGSLKSVKQFRDATEELFGVLLS